MEELMDRGTRIHQKEVYAKKQAKIARMYGSPIKSEKHAETSAMTCGDSNCVMCGNPRKTFNDLTKQEKSMFQNELQDI
jgi:hypothetical protein